MGGAFGFGVGFGGAGGFRLCLCLALRHRLCRSIDTLGPGLALSFDRNFFLLPITVLFLVIFVFSYRSETSFPEPSSSHPPGQRR